jgi:hypothetical protein
MTIGFFLVLRSDPDHYLHAAALVREAGRLMPACGVCQLTDRQTPAVPGRGSIVRLDFADETPLLEQRLTLYAKATKSGAPWLLLDTDVQIRNSVAGVFDDPVFDVALCDRNWPHVQQGETMLQTMPFNTGVVFTRSSTFWADVLAVWQGFPDAQRADWLSEQAAVYQVVRSGKYRIKILPGLFYNYPPNSADDVPAVAALVHYKGPRKVWRSAVAYQELSR